MHKSAAFNVKCTFQRIILNTATRSDDLPSYFKESRAYDQHGYWTESMQIKYTSRPGCMFALDFIRYESRQNVRLFMFLFY